MTESMVSASLSIIGSSVLHIDRETTYGGNLLSPTHEALRNYCQADTQVQLQPKRDNDGISISEVVEPREMSFKETWFIDDNSSGQTTNLTVERSELTLDATLPATEISTDTSVSQSTGSTNVIPDRMVLLRSLTRSRVEAKCRLSEIDFMPRILFATSPNMTATLRSDVQRHLQFRFINRLLAYLTEPNAQPDGSSRSSGSPENLISVPMCRSDVFRSRVLGLRQKRCLGKFLEWCKQDKVTDSIIYKEKKDLPIRAALNDCDEFTQNLVINNLLMADDSITLEAALPRILTMLHSMNRFGPYPMLWPMYGTADFPMAYCRMSAVYGATTCLDCSIRSIQRMEKGSERRYLIELTNGHKVKADFLVIGAYLLAKPVVEPTVNRWICRAVFLTTASLLPEDSRTSDVTLLPFPLLKAEGVSHSILPYLLESAIVTNRDPALTLYMCQAVAVTEVPPANLEQLFDPMKTNLFITEACNGDDSKPRLLYACYFKVPVLSNVDSFPFGDEEEIFYAPGADASLTLDSCVDQAEKIFRRIFQRRRSRISQSVEQVTSTPDTGIQLPAAASATDGYISLEAFWDGIFPPRPPSPEHLNVNHPMDE